MFKKLLNKLNWLAREQSPPFDPSRFDDPVAELTQWSPASKTSSNFRSHKLILTGYNCLEFKRSPEAVIDFITFFSAFLGILIFSLIIVPKLKPVARYLNLFLIVESLIILNIVVSFYFLSAPIVFNKTYNFFWKGRKNPYKVYDKSTIKFYTELDNIHALQIISKYCEDDENPFYSYELNLVLQDGRRINIIDYGNKTKLLEDTDTLAEFLNVPIWDAS